MKDVVLVVAPQNRGWILDRICREIASVAPDRCYVHVFDGSIPPAKSVFFSHYSLLPVAAGLASVRGARRTVFFTHPPTRRRERFAAVLALRAADRIVSMSSIHARSLRRLGLRSRVRVIVPGTDPSRFQAHARGSGLVGFCSAYYERKSPGTLLSVVEQNPHERFLLVGRNWRNCPYGPQLEGLPNLEYVEAEYEAYPALYRQMDVFVSPSKLEGGPMPLLEAMMSNVVPIATRTGFAPDVIVNGVNGFLLDINASIQDYSASIDRARKLSVDVRASIAHRTWEAFGREVLSEIG